MNIEQNPLSAGQITILIETSPMTPRTVGSPSPVPCFRSVAWDVENSRPIDEHLTSGGTLGQATIKGLDMLQPSIVSTHRSTGLRIERTYWCEHHHHEVFVLRNGRIWLRLSVTAKQSTKDTVFRGGPRCSTTRDRAEEQSFARLHLSSKRAASIQHHECE